jgi:hypothetical protein
MQNEKEDEKEHEKEDKKEDEKEDDGYENIIAGLRTSFDADKPAEPPPLQTQPEPEPTVSWPAERPPKQPRRRGKRRQPRLYRPPPPPAPTVPPQELIEALMRKQQPPPRSDSGEFAGLGLLASQCCYDCRNGDCVITRGGSGCCGHPRGSGLQGVDMGNVIVLQRYQRARAYLSHLETDRKFAAMT